MDVENPKIIAILVGALVSCVYVLGETLKAALFSKRRREESERFECKLASEGERLVDKMRCHFSTEDHARLSDTVLMSKTNEVMLEGITVDQGKLLNSIERIVDKFEDVARELRAETNMIRLTMAKNRNKGD